MERLASGVRSAINNECCNGPMLANESILSRSPATLTGRTGVHYHDLKKNCSNAHENADSAWQEIWCANGAEAGQFS